MECDFAIALPYLFQLQDNSGIVEDLQGQHSRTLGTTREDFKIAQTFSWSTFQPRDASTTLEDFRLVVLGDA
jgi:hypothetical protein